MEIQETIINTVKLLIYKENEHLLEKINFDNDNIFLEPLLFTYFNSKQGNLFSSQLLTEIIQGHFTVKEPLVIKESLNNEGVAYIPNIGYFDSNQNKIDDILKVDVFEILKCKHPLLNKYFYEYYKGDIVNPNPDYSSVWKDNYKELEASILIIKEHLPEFYKEMSFVIKTIFLHDNPKIINFTSIEALGMLYFYILGKDNLIYFIEEIIHQASHNILYYITFNHNEFFKIDSQKAMMRDLTGHNWDYRTFYGAFHGLYTITKRLEGFDKLLSKNVFEGKEKHELLGRTADMFPRLKNGLESLKIDEVYTDKGKKLYLDLTDKSKSIMSKYKKLENEFDLSHRDLDFRYHEFCLTNSYEDFLKKEAQNYYNF